MPHQDGRRAVHSSMRSLVGTPAIPRRAVLAGGAAAAALGSRRAAAQSPAIRIGVLTDMSGPYSDSTGPGSVVAANMAAEDAMAAYPGLKVEIISGDMQQKADVGLSVARRWFDEQGVTALVDMPNSAVALAVAGLVKEKNKVALFSGAASSDITGKACGPNHIHWTHDSYGITSAVAKAVVQNGGKTWFFITANYTFGASVEENSRRFVQAAGGTVLGGVRYPFPETTDFSSYLVQAKASGAQVIGLAMSGTDVSNCVKQGGEFGIGAPRKGPEFAGLAILIDTIETAGLDAAQGMLLAETFYWDYSDGTRAFSDRFRARNHRGGAVPTMNQAGVYGAIWHYLKAVNALGAPKAAADGRAAVVAMQDIPCDDPLFGPGKVRVDGRTIHDVHLFRVKTPAQSRNKWDLYEHVATVPGDQAFRPLADGGCPLVRT